jgi:hypothetical protein
MSFAIFRHPDVAVAGVVADTAAEQQRALGWYRVSNWSDSSTFNLPAFTADAPDLDAEPEPVDEADDEKDEE